MGEGRPESHCELLCRRDRKCKGKWGLVREKGAVLDARTLRSELSSKRGESGTLTFDGVLKTSGREARTALRSAICILSLERKVRWELGLDGMCGPSKVLLV